MNSFLSRAAGLGASLIMVIGAVVIAGFSIFVGVHETLWWPIWTGCVIIPFWLSFWVGVVEWSLDF